MVALPRSTLVCAHDGEAEWLRSKVNREEIKQIKDWKVHTRLGSCQNRANALTTMQPTGASLHDRMHPKRGAGPRCVGGTPTRS